MTNQKEETFRVTEQKTTDQTNAERLFDKMWGKDSAPNIRAYHMRKIREIEERKMFKKKKKS